MPSETGLLYSFFTASCCGYGRCIVVVAQSNETGPPIPSRIDASNLVAQRGMLRIYESPAIEAAGLDTCLFLSGARNLAKSGSSPLPFQGETRFLTNDAFFVLRLNHGGSCCSVSSQVKNCGRCGIHCGIVAHNCFSRPKGKESSLRRFLPRFRNAPANE